MCICVFYLFAIKMSVDNNVDDGFVWLCRMCGEEFENHFQRNEHEAAVHFNHEVICFNFFLISFLHILYYL